MTEYVLQQAEARGIYFAAIFETLGERPLVKITGHVVLAATYKAKDAALTEAAALPGKWIVCNTADIPPRIIK